VMVELCPRGRRGGQTLAEIPSSPLPQKMQKITAVAWIFKRLGAAHTMIFWMFWGRSRLSWMFWGRSRLQTGVYANGIKLDSKTLQYQFFASISAWSESPQASLGQRVTAGSSIHFDQAARRLRRARIPLTIDKKMAFD
jgi:hypothetical protein